MQGLLSKGEATCRSSLRLARQVLALPHLQTIARRCRRGGRPGAEHDLLHPCPWRLPIAATLEIDCALAERARHCPTLEQLQPTRSLTAACFPLDELPPFTKKLQDLTEGRGGLQHHQENTAALIGDSRGTMAATQVQVSEANAAGGRGGGGQRELGHLEQAAAPLPAPDPPPTSPFSRSPSPLWSAALGQVQVGVSW